MNQQTIEALKSAHIAYVKADYQNHINSMKPIEFTNTMAGKEIQTSFLGHKYVEAAVPVLWTELTEANIDFDHCIPVATRKANYEAGIYASFDCKKVKITWYPEFDYEAGMVDINPITISIEADIVKEVDDSEDTDPVKTEIDVSKEKPPTLIKSFDDGADRGRQYGPHSVLFLINERDEVEAHVFYS